MKKDRDWDTCLGCGSAPSVALPGAMDPKTLLWDMEKCISCMACVSRCPVGALGYNSAGHRHPADGEVLRAPACGGVPCKSGTGKKPAGTV